MPGGHHHSGSERWASGRDRSSTAYPKFFFRRPCQSGEDAVHVGVRLKAGQAQNNVPLADRESRFHLAHGKTESITQGRDGTCCQ
jgi:hypothetical protein